MKNIFKTSSVILCAILAVSAGAISANAACPTDIKAFICSPNCNFDDICNLTGSCEDIKALIEKFGIIPENVPCTDCSEDNNTSCTDCEENNNITAPQMPVQEYSVSAYEQKVADLVNEIRVQNGLSPLSLNTKLSEVARIKSQDMKDKKYFSHTSPTYGSPFDMMKQFGISYRTAGENIAMGQQTPEIVVNAWMNSEGHRANILNPSFTQIGVGYAADGNYWTQMFIG